MKKEEKKINVRELIAEHEANCVRINELADLMETENREMNDSEKAEFKNLERRNSIISMKLRAAEKGNSGEVPAMKNNDTILRENLLEKGTKVSVMLYRDVTPQTTEALDGTGIIPVAEQEMLKPIRTGLIWDKVGINIRSGLSGKLRWPKHSKAVASFADEAERLVDSKIDWNKLEMQGKRLGLAIPVTREELEDSQGIVESVVTEEMPKAIVDVINEALFTTTGQYTAADGQQHEMSVVGPFKALAESPTTFAGAVPTRRELLQMVAKVASKLNLEAPCWVMTEAMKAELSDVKVDKGSGRFLCENDMILGYPVFVTSAIGEDYIGFGDWSYQAAGFFGSWSLIVDPYTLARQNSVDFSLNTRFGTTTLREDAFVLGKVAGE